jgi:hypothetical protein
VDELGRSRKNGRIDSYYSHCLARGGKTERQYENGEKK